MTPGPADIKLADQAVLKIAEGQTFIPEAEAGRLLLAMGNRSGTGLPGNCDADGQGKNGSWSHATSKPATSRTMTRRTGKPTNYCRTSGKGTEESNKVRKSRGIPEMEIVGWGAAADV
jgi:uncharacterized membrane-anchored protein